MIKFNAKMKKLLANISSNNFKNNKLYSIAKSGFITKNGCIFLKELYKDHYDEYLISQFHDETGFEAFVNSVHVADYQKSLLLECGINFITDVFDEFEKYSKNIFLKAIMTFSEEDVNIKFIVDRRGQLYLSNNLEKYENAILEMTNADIEDFKNLLLEKNYRF